MRKLLVLGAIATALVVPEAASAGCWATVGLSSTPTGTAPGEAWNVEITVLQHGRTPLADAKPTVAIRNAATGEGAKFTAKPTGKTGVYRARVVFPSAGRWSYEVFDGFTSYNGSDVPCAQTHTFAPVTIGAASSPSRPSRTPPAAPASSTESDFGSGLLWPAVGIVLAGIAVSGVGLAAGRRIGRRVAAR